MAHSDAAACGSIDAANDVCQAGDLVLIKGGNYAGGTQNISGWNNRAAHCVVGGVSGERVLMKRLSLGGVRWLTIRGVESLEMDCSNGGIACSDNTFVPNNKRALYVDQRLAGRRCRERQVRRLRDLRLTPGDDPQQRLRAV